MLHEISGNNERLIGMWKNRVAGGKNGRVDGEGDFPRYVREGRGYQMFTRVQ